MKRSSSFEPRALGGVDQREPHPVQVLGHLGDLAEVGEAERLRVPAGDRVQRVEPGLHVDVRRRRRRDDERIRRDAHAGHVAHVGVAGLLVQVGDVVRGVAGRVGHAEALDGLAAAERVMRSSGGGVYATRKPSTVSPPLSAVMRSSGTGATSPHSSHMSSPYRRPALFRSFEGSTGAARPARARRPSGRDSAGRARRSRPAWSRWMWVRSSARGSTAPRRSSSVSTQEAGPGSTITPVDLVGADHPVAPQVQHVDRAAHRAAGPYNHLRVSEHRLPEPDRPWVMRTYAGHSTAKESNELYRTNLAKGQTGLSVAFDLPTQTGYDPDDELSRGEVGKVGVSIAHKGDMHTLLDGIPLDEMNTSMTINATAAWLLALYMTVAEENGVDRQSLQGTTQNDIIKEFLSRGTYAFPPEPSMRLIADMIAFTVDEVPQLEPDQHLLVPPPGGGRDAGAGDRLLALDGAGRARPGARARARGDLPARVRPHVVLRERRHPLRRGAREAARDGPAVGGARPRALRRRRRAHAALPLRRAGELARADRVAAGEQHHPDRARGAGRDDGPRRARPRAAAAGLERGARAAAAVGPAVVAADPADPRLRDRPARVPGHLRGLEGDGRAGGRAGGRRARGDGRWWPSRAAPWRPCRT